MAMTILRKAATPMLSRGALGPWAGPLFVGGIFHQAVGPRSGPLARQFTSVRSPDAIAMIETGEWAYLDIRTTMEQKKVGFPALPEHGAGLATVTSHVPAPGGRVFDPESWIEKVRAKFPDKEQKIIVGCANGVRSKEACEVLTDDGYTEVYELDDGYMGWRGRGMPVTLPTP